MACKDDQAHFKTDPAESKTMAEVSPKVTADVFEGNEFWQVSAARLTKGNRIGKANGSSIKSLLCCDSLLRRNSRSASQTRSSYTRKLSTNIIS